VTHKPYNLVLARFRAEEYVVPSSYFSEALDEIERLEAMTVKERARGLRAYYEDLLCDANEEISKQRAVLLECVEVLRCLKPRRGWIQQLIGRCKVPERDWGLKGRAL
jgi:hypothetical protein